MTARYLTAAWLDKQGACSYQADLAILHFGRRVRLTRTVLLEAAELGLDLYWLAGKLLSPSQWAEYEREHAPLLAAYQRQYATLRAAYERRHAPLLAEYERRRALRAEYERRRALLLADLLQLEAL